MYHARFNHKSDGTEVRHERRKYMATVLIVEDHSGLRDLLVDYFIASGTDCLGASCVAEARQVLRERWVDVVVTDLILPDGPGTRVIEDCRTFGVPVMVLTALPENIARRFCPSDVPVLVHPVPLGVLLVRVRGLQYRVRPTWKPLHSDGCRSTLGRYRQ